MPPGIRNDVTKTPMCLQEFNPSDRSSGVGVRALHDILDLWPLRGAYIHLPRDRRPPLSRFWASARMRWGWRGVPSLRTYSLHFDIGRGLTLTPSAITSDIDAPMGHPQYEKGNGAGLPTPLDTDFIPSLHTALVKCIAPNIPSTYSANWSFEILVQYAAKRLEEPVVWITYRARKPLAATKCLEIVGENIQELTQLALADVVIAVEAEFRVVVIIECSLEERLCIVVIESWYVVILGAVVARTAATLARIVGLVLPVVEAAFEASRTELGQKSDEKESVARDALGQAHCRSYSAYTAESILFVWLCSRGWDPEYSPGRKTGKSEIGNYWTWWWLVTNLGSRGSIASEAWWWLKRSSGARVTFGHT
ncbi:hypothetical protein C8J57DRAFT_1463208 [Mycena rebaudengoi]|nr:hypothetical protein C8J57DRAFT_1463208 [Mycena rebaudengoi]